MLLSCKSCAYLGSTTQEDNEISHLSSTTWNQQIREESAGNLMKLDSSNSSVKNHAISVISDYSQEDREVMLQPEDFLFFISTC